MTYEGILKNEESAILKLRTLYRKYGYLPFKMSKFEEYDLYVRNKDFLVSDSVITFNDTNGKLLALKPDVTLSIIKSGNDEMGCKQKYYYNENVYRISKGAHCFREIMQTGVECMGDIDIYDIFEVVSLAANSLYSISQDFVLEISHLGIISAILSEFGAEEEFEREIIKCLAEKNIHETKRICAKYGISESNTQMLSDFVSIYGDMKSVLKKLDCVCADEKFKKALDELKFLCKLLEQTKTANNIKLDFSVVNDMNYYNGIVFKGFLNGVCEGVLSGGQYDKLMRRMNRKSGAIGFALYLDLLEGIDNKKSGYDVDVLLLYSEKSDVGNLIKKINFLIDRGMSVSAQREIPQKLRYREIINADEEN